VWEVRDGGVFGGLWVSRVWHGWVRIWALCECCSHEVSYESHHDVHLTSDPCMRPCGSACVMFSNGFRLGNKATLCIWVYDEVVIACQICLGLGGSGHCSVCHRHRKQKTEHEVRCVLEISSPATSCFELAASLLCEVCYQALSFRK